MSYTILSDGKAIHCGQCGRISHNPNDVKARYCGHCNVFHDDKGAPMWGIFSPIDGLLCADTEQKIRELRDRWRATTREAYFVRALTRAEIDAVLGWRETFGK